MDRRSSHVAPELNITIQAEREPEDSPAGPSNSHESKDGRSYPSVRPARRRREEPLGAPHPASKRPRSRRSGSSGRSSLARSASSSSSEVLLASYDSDPDNQHRTPIHQMASNRGEVASHSSAQDNLTTGNRSSSDDNIDLQIDYGSGRETNSYVPVVSDARPRRGTGSQNKTRRRRPRRVVKAAVKLSNLKRASLELALGLTVYQFERTHEDLTVRDALAALRTEDDRLNPEAQKTLQEFWDRSGFQEQSEEEKTQNMKTANRPILTASFDGKSFLAR